MNIYGMDCSHKQDNFTISEIDMQDGKWHILFEESDQVHIDGKRVWKKKSEQLT